MCQDAKELMYFSMAKNEAHRSKMHVKQVDVILLISQQKFKNYLFSLPTSKAAQSFASTIIME